MGGGRPILSRPWFGGAIGGFTGQTEAEVHGADANKGINQTRNFHNQLKWIGVELEAGLRGRHGRRRSF
jgi:hypothetical protein